MEKAKRGGQEQVWSAARKSPSGLSRAAGISHPEMPLPSGPWTL